MLGRVPAFGARNVAPTCHSAVRPSARLQEPNDRPELHRHASHHRSQWIDERQHDEAVAFFDKPHVLTVSGVHRGEQRRIYDERRLELIPQNGLTLVVIPARAFELKAGKIARDPETDLKTVRALLPSTAEWSESMTPSDLARELGVSPKTVREYLRSAHGLLAENYETRWLLDSVRAADVRNHFSTGA